MARNQVEEKEYFTVHEVAKRWKVSAMTVTRTFQDQSGVLKLGSVGILHKKRAYVTLRISAETLQRVEQDRSSGFGAEVQRGRRAV